MVDLVLQDARIPARGFDAHRLTEMVDGFNEHPASP
jgi:hypothetical protein